VKIAEHKRRNWKPMFKIGKNRVADSNRVGGRATQGTENEKRGCSAGGECNGKGRPYLHYESGEMRGQKRKEREK